MRKFIQWQLAAIIFMLGNTLFAQLVPIRDTLAVNAIQAGVQSNGAFFLGGSNGLFLAPAIAGELPSVPLMKAAGLWLGGRDSLGNLQLSAQLYNDNGKTDFYPGILSEEGIPHPVFNLIAGVTRSEVDAHMANPGSIIPAIYGWPGQGNPYFFNYHGFDLPYNYYAGYAGFYDPFGDGLYNPASGDYPVIEVRGCPLNYVADEALWFAFHDVGAHTQSGGGSMNMEIQTELLGFNCPEGSPLDQVLFVRYKLLNRNMIQLDSCYFGVFLDFEIGNGDDDYIGCDPARRMVYAYNGDELDEGGFESSPPVMAVDLLRGPLHHETYEEVAEWHFIPFNDEVLNSPEQYYYVLSGRNPDGSALPNNGLMYTGDPLDPAQWSELSDGNTPGERKAMMSVGPFTLLPGAVNELILAYFWVRKGAAGSVAENLSVLDYYDTRIQFQFDICFSLYDGCPSSVSTRVPIEALRITVTPNPFSDWIKVACKESPLQSIWLYDATGRLLKVISVDDSESVMIPTADLPVGMYRLQVRSKDARWGSYPLIRM